MWGHQSPGASLTRSECLDRLALATIGRIGASIEALPVILPVSYSVIEEAVLFRTVPGTRLDAATIGAVVAFQADCFEDAGDRGWCVLVQGVACAVTEAEERAMTRPPALPAWTVPGPEPRLVRLATTNLSGRTFGSGSTYTPGQ
jgi:nitroimidazol reductase NimA-like FMN-containing flavoprotein (pyridoxamine 5'-phosphate oxidase superfamily)